MTNGCLRDASEHKIVEVASAKPRMFLIRISSCLQEEERWHSSHAITGPAGTFEPLTGRLGFGGHALDG
jgi:hypothetical protein